MKWSMIVTRIYLLLLSYQYMNQNSQDFGNLKIWNFTAGLKRSTKLVEDKKKKKMVEPVFFEFSEISGSYLGTDPLLPAMAFHLLDKWTGEVGLSVQRNSTVSFFFCTELFIILFYNFLTRVSRSPLSFQWVESLFTAHSAGPYASTVARQLTATTNARPLITRSRWN